MGTFDSILEHVGTSAGDLFGDDAGDLLDNVQHAFSDSSDADDEGSDGGDSWTDTLGGLFGGGADDDAHDSEGESGGWGALSGLVDRLSGDGDADGDGNRDSLFSSVLDKATSFLPEDLRDEAESLFRGGDGGSSWAGSLLDRVTDSRSTQPDAVGDADDLVTGRPAAPQISDEEFDAITPRDTIVAGDDASYPDDPTFPDDGPVAAPVDDGIDSADVSPAPMDDFQQDIADADAIDDSFDTMFEGLE